MIIAKRFEFDAAHQLHNLPDDHKCRRMHGHTYKVEIVLEGDPDPHTGMIVDYADIATAWQVIHDKLDHRYLNDVPGLEIPTTEVLAVWIMAHLDPEIGTRHVVGALRVPLLQRVRVKESTTTWCEVTRADVFVSAMLSKLADAVR